MSDLSETCNIWRPSKQYVRANAFLIYINYIKNSSKKLDFYFFADGTSLLLTGKTIEQIEALCNLELKGFTDWLKANKLMLNVEKSNLVLFRRPRKKVTESIILLTN